MANQEFDGEVVFYQESNYRKICDSSNIRLLNLKFHVYHFGASLKDLGKKVCAVMKMEESKETILRIIEN